MRLIPVILAATLSSACATDNMVSPSKNGNTDSAFAGTWMQRGAVVGSSLVLTLQVQGTTVTGTGTYSIEGGRSGALTETGTISGEMLSLTIAYDYGESAQFAGQTESASVLSGTLHFGPPQSLTPAAVVTFDKKN